jgi:hypothetical protein
MATPTLLRLPRELRDIIYIYVHQEVTVKRWSYPFEPSHFIRRRYFSTDVVFTTVPILSLLLVNAQLCHEHLETPHFASVSADFKLIGGYDDTSEISLPPATEQCFNELLLHTTDNAILLEDFDELDWDFVDFIWTYLKTLAEIFTSKAP